ncbi:hypothetical protein [Klebsiella variicola]|nr:hypothetical protein [Klebsiella variicola]MEC6197828.1 hypothetical protein [Klebsiella variicola]HCQ8411688.1 hypothetical protein [Klebsiella variicola]
MVSRLCFWALFTIVLLVSWRLASMLVELVIIVAVLSANMHLPFKRKT